MCAAHVFSQGQLWDYRGDQGDKEGGQVDELESEVGLRVGGMARVGAGAARVAFSALVDVFVAVRPVPCRVSSLVPGPCCCPWVRTVGVGVRAWGCSRCQGEGGSVQLVGRSLRCVKLVCLFGNG